MGQILAFVAKLMMSRIRAFWVFFWTYILLRQSRFDSDIWRKKIGCSSPWFHHPSLVKTQVPFPEFLFSKLKSFTGVTLCARTLKAAALIMIFTVARWVHLINASWQIFLGFPQKTRCNCSLEVRIPSVQGKYIPPRREDEEDDQGSEIEKVLTFRNALMSWHGSASFSGSH